MVVVKWSTRLPSTLTIQVRIPLKPTVIYEKFPVTGAMVVVKWSARLPSSVAIRVQIPLKLFMKNLQLSRRLAAATYCHISVSGKAERE